MDYSKIEAGYPKTEETIITRLEANINATIGRLKQARTQPDSFKKVLACKGIKGYLKGLYAAYATIHGYTKADRKSAGLWRIGNEIFYKERK